MRGVRSAVLLTAVLLSVGAGLTACADPASDGGAAATSAAPPTPQVSAGQTLWTIAGTDERLPDDDRDVQAVRTLTTLHSGAVDDRGPDDIHEALQAEFSMYTPEFAATLEGSGWRESSAERTVEHGVATEQIALAWLRSSIAADRASATAQYESTLVFTAADQAFLEENGIELGQQYRMLREVSAAVVDGEWRISGVRESGLQKAASPE